MALHFVLFLWLVVRWTLQSLFTCYDCVNHCASFLLIPKVLCRVWNLRTLECFELFVVTDAWSLPLRMFSIFKDVVNDCGFLTFVVNPRGLTMNFVEVWTSVRKFITLYIAVILSFGITLKHVRHLNVLKLLFVTFLGHPHDRNCLARCSLINTLV